MSFDRKFVLRNSLLTDLYRNEHIGSVHHLFIAGYLLLFISNGIDDYLKKGRVELGLRLITESFGKFHIAVAIYVGYLIVGCLVYLFFIIWAKNRNFHNMQHVRLWDRFWTLLIIVHHITNLVIATKLVTVFDLPTCSSAFVLIEQVRFFAKTHSFVRNNAAKVSSHKFHSDDKLQLPYFSHFLYFLLVQPLVYSDTYPRNARINWTFAFFSLLESLCTLSFISLILDLYLFPSVRDFGKHKTTPIELVLIILKNTPSGLLITLSFYYIATHSWPNFMSELTRFGDRRFYEDWWNCNDVSTFMRKQSMMPQEWLHFYVYKDLQKYTRSTSARLKVAVMLFSSIFHEWIATYSLGFFCPFVMLFYWIAGGIILCLGKSQKVRYNIVFWMFVGFGGSFLITMYSVEYYARRNVPLENPEAAKNWSPRFISVIV